MKTFCINLHDCSCLVNKWKKNKKTISSLFKYRATAE